MAVPSRKKLYKTCALEALVNGKTNLISNLSVNPIISVCVRYLVLFVSPKGGVRIRYTHLHVQ